MYKQFALKVYFSVFSLAIFCACQDQKTAPKPDATPDVVPVAARIPVPSDTLETAVAFENGMIKTASGQLVPIPMYGDQAACTFYIVRHAEKVMDGSENPDLTPAGQQRAVRLGAVLKGIRVDYIATTNLKRSIETGKQLYQHIGAPPFQTFPPDMIGTWLTDMLDAGGGRGYIHIGHSNTIPELLKLLGVPDADHMVIDEKDYAQLFIVAIKKKKAKMIRFRYD
jgi:2,3-bisphosphoglycerate-dependent phosphoglycerate mutase